MIVTIAILSTVGVLICHKYNSQWDYMFGTLFFAGFPFAGLIEDGFMTALLGYSTGMIMLIGMTLFVYCLEYYMTGKWECSV